MKNSLTLKSDENFIRQNLKDYLEIFSNNPYPKHMLKKVIYNSKMYDDVIEDFNLGEIYST